MRKLNLLIMIIAVLVVSLPVSAATVAHWTFNDPALGAANGAAMPDSDGQTVWRVAATDKSGNGNDLTTWDYPGSGFNWTTDSYFGDFGMTAVSSWPAAMTWSAKSLPAGINAETITPIAWTVEAVFKSSNLSSNRAILGRDGNIGGAAAMYFATRGTQLAIEYRDGAGLAHNLQVAVGLQTNTWYHAVGVCDGTTLKLYLDGVLRGTLNVSGSSNPALALGMGTWSVARGIWNNSHGDRFFGVHDEVAISNVALDPSEFVIKQYAPGQTDNLSGKVIGDMTDSITNRSFELPGTGDIKTNWGLIPGWNSSAPATDSGVIGGNSGANGTTYHGFVGDIDQAAYQITSEVIAANTPYTLEVQMRSSYSSEKGKIALFYINPADPNTRVILAEKEQTGLGGSYVTVTASFTSSSAGPEIGKNLGILLDCTDGDNASWTAFDEIRLYQQAIHGVINHNPVGLAAHAAPGTVNLTWTPSNDPNLVSQILYSFVGNGDGSNPDITSYLAVSGTPLSSAVTSAPITLGYDQYCIWRVDSVIDANSVTGLTVVFNSESATPVVTAVNPAFIAVPGGADTTLTVGSTYVDTYQWYKSNDASNSTSGDDVIVGTDSNSLTINSVLLSENDEGYYYCKGTNNISGKTAKSTVGRVMEQRLTSYYDFDQDLVDSVSGYNGTLAQEAASAGLPTFVSDSNSLPGLGYYLKLDNSDHATDPNGQYVQLPAGIVDYADITISLWVHPTAVGSWARVFDFGNTTTDYLYLTLDNGGYNTRSTIKIDNGTEQNLISDFDSSNWSAPGTWYHFVITIGGNTGTLYRNGEPIAVNTGMTVNPIDVGAVLNYIGKSQWPNDPEFSGYIDELRIYNKALTAQEAAQLYVDVLTGSHPCYEPDFVGSYYNTNDEGSSRCKVDLADFADFAQAWLSDGLL
jgi:hypothetical protein